MVIAEPEPCCVVADPPPVDAVDEGASVRDKTSGSVGRRSFKRTKPEAADFTGVYRLSSRNFMNFSCAGTTLAGLVNISKDGSGSAFFSTGVSTCQKGHILRRDKTGHT